MSQDTPTIDFNQIEQKWQDRWASQGIFDLDVSSFKDKHYLLTMFPYPSGDRLHMGHWYQYGIVDVWARYQMMKGVEVFQPMGFDAFGLPAENFAIKKGIHPDDSTSKNVEVMKNQFKKMGVAFNWRYMLDTSKPNYYKWTQKIFLDLYEKGLAYKKEAPVNWCNSCATVLANEQVKDGACERCEGPVARKNLSQWFFGITEYAQELLDCIDDLDWPHKTKAMQKNWIGRSEGTTISFGIEGHDEVIEAFTTRPDTLFGVTYVTLAPEHPLVDKLTTPEKKQEVDAYIEATARLSEIDRQSTTKEKTGVFSGSYARNPLSDELIPIWIGDYVLVTYGSGAVMAVPAHDQRDFEFAQKFDLPIKKVVDHADCGDPLTEAYSGEGTMVHSAEFDGLPNQEAKEKITSALEVKGKGAPKVTFRLRDWLVSRQRYWGCPIPIVYCKTCGEQPLKLDDLPVQLPRNVNFKPTGESPLATCEEFKQTTCPKCGEPAVREVDTLDTFVCSSWYFLRFPNVGNDEIGFEPALTNKILPVDTYVGGAEHSCMHLLYARFMTKALRDLGQINFSEPFPRLIHQGLVLGEDGNKMSKSKGNSVSPDPYVEKYGADILRLYLCFGFNYVDGGPWEDGGFVAVTRFLEKVERLIGQTADLLKFGQEFSPKELSKDDKKLLFVFHNSCKGVTQDTERFMFNTSIARLMELYNGVTDYLKKVPEDQVNQGVLRQVLIDFVKLLAPFAPHRTEELWEGLGYKESLFKASWPEWKSEYLVLDQVKLGVMVNGKFRDEIEVAKDAGESDVEGVALESQKVQRALEGKNIVKKIFVPGKMFNFVAK